MISKTLKIVGAIIGTAIALAFLLICYDVGKVTSPEALAKAQAEWKAEADAERRRVAEREYKRRRDESEERRRVEARRERDYHEMHCNQSKAADMAKTSPSCWWLEDHPYRGDGT